MASVGEELRRQREARGLSIEDIARATRISSRYLKAIEENRFDQLPGGAYNRAFIRAYAEHLELDPDDLLRLYAAAAQPAREQPLPSLAAGYEKSRSMTPFIILAALVTLVAILYLGHARLQRRWSGRLLEERPAAAADERAKPGKPEQQAQSRDELRAALIEQTGSRDEQAQPLTAQPPAGQEAERLYLELEALDSCWLDLHADNVRLVHKLLSPGERFAAQANNSFWLKVGSAGDLAIRLNGIEAEKLGSRGQVKEVLITLDNFKSFLSKQN